MNESMLSMPSASFIPDELTDEERARFSAEAIKHTILHVKALIQIMGDPGATHAELTAFAGQTYIEGFRGRVLRHSMRKMEAEDRGRNGDVS